MGGVFNKLRGGLKKTREGFTNRLRLLLRSDAALTPELLEEIEEILIGADIGVATAEELMEEIRNDMKRGKVTTADGVYSLLKKIIETGLCFENGRKDELSFSPPRIILVVGVNGTGKTTSIGKLAHYFSGMNKKVLLAAGDTYRAAAAEQLDEWSRRADADLVRSKSGADPGAVVYDSINAALSRNIDVVIIDTAGRLHTKINLMEELKKIERVIKKVNPEAPHEVLLVLDANTGQNGIVQAREFLQAVPVTGIILTKLDGTAKGGIVVSIARQLKLPVNYIGVGEGITDFERFDPHEFVEALFE